MGDDPFQLLVILSIVAILIGGQRIPDVMRWLGESINNLRGPRGGPPNHPLPVTGHVETTKPKHPDHDDALRSRRVVQF